MPPATLRRPTNLAARSAERDALLNWLEALEADGAAPEAIALVRSRLERVERDIAEPEGADAFGFSPPATGRPRGLPQDRGAGGT